MKKFCIHLAAIWVVTVYLSATPGFAGNTAQQKAPIKLGTSGRNGQGIKAALCCPGTFGSLVKASSGNQYILSNNHVLARSNAGTAGELIMQRGYVDTLPA